MNRGSQLNLLLMIDSLHCGGAQRQLCALAAGLKDLGHSVQVAVYYPQFDHFRSFLAERGIRVIDMEYRSIGTMTARVAQIARTEGIDWIVAFLRGASTFALLAKLRALGSFKVCVGERSANLDGKFNIRETVERSLYRFSDLIVANSQFQRDVLRRRWPALATRTHSIPNCIDEEFFHKRANTTRTTPPKLLAVGQIYPLKNLHGLVEAMRIYRERHGTPPLVSWAGRVGESCQQYFEQQRERIHSLGLTNSFQFVGELSDIAQFLRSGDALIHPSSLEGFPNAVCEALAGSLPVIIGDISDGANLVGRGTMKRGFLFNPAEADSISEAIHAFVRLDSTESQRMAISAFEYASETFRHTQIAEKYSTLLQSQRSAGSLG